MTWRAISGRIYPVRPIRTAKACPVTRIESAGALAAARQASDLPVALLVSTKDTTGPLHKFLALRFWGRMGPQQFGLSGLREPR